MTKFTAKHSKALERIASKTASVAPFTADTPGARSARLACAMDPSWAGYSYFCATYFPHIFTLSWAPAHQTMFTAVQDHSGVIAITGFRGLGKTVLMAVVYSIWAILRGERYVIHTAADEDLANERTSFIRHELVANRRLLSDFPELAPQDADTYDYYLKNHTRIRARGIKQAHRGTINPRTARRPGLIVCDDIDLEINQGNQRIGRQKLIKITEELFGALDPAQPGRVLWLGNLVNPNYAISQFLALILGDIRSDRPEFDPGHVQILKTRTKALLRFSVENPDGSSAWPEQYPTARLEDLRSQYGPTGYQREMLGQPVIEGNLFKNEWFAYFRDLPDHRDIRRCWLYVDPAWGEKNCYKAVVVIAWDGARFYLTHAWVRQTANLHLYQYVYDVFHFLDRLYRARFRAAFEVSYGQARLLDEFDRWAADRGLPPISHRIKRIDNRENKNLRIERLETTIASGKLLFTQGQDVPTLVSQFLTYPDGFLDGPDAVAGCLERFAEYDVARNRVRVRRVHY